MNAPVCACGKELNPKQRRKRDICRRCQLIEFNSDREMIARRTAGQIRANQLNPERRELRRERCREAAAKRMAVPGYLEKCRQTILIAQAASCAPDVVARRSLAIQDRFLSWCPRGRRDEYRSLRIKVGAIEARRIIEQDIDAKALRSREAGR